LEGVWREKCSEERLEGEYWAENVRGGWILAKGWVLDGHVIVPGL